ncbi:hypothetical protein HNR08_003457 [Cellulomonas hominis]|uniref:Uncharacterized protein n=1 Tax=Cellulomonas hominis TaxID=156981 RepID=A0A7W8SGL6_9CELL|nr:hypothetical protein [Cellulomonas hominis]
MGAGVNGNLVAALRAWHWRARRLLATQQRAQA